jgi:hypothetical protein
VEAWTRGFEFVIRWQKLAGGSGRVSFQGKYQILASLGAGEAQSFRARQHSSGRSVILHYFAVYQAPARQPDLPSLIFSFLRNAAAERSQQLLDMGEDEGHIIVVTADAPECRDLRQWLESGLEPQVEEEGNAHPADVPSGPAKPASTYVFNTEALRQAWSSREDIPAAPASLTAHPAVPPPNEGPDDLLPPAKDSAAPFLNTEFGQPSVVRFWEKFSEADAAEHPAPVPMPSAGLKNADVRSGVPQGTAFFLPHDASLGGNQASDQVLTPPTLPADRRQTGGDAAGLAPGGGGAGNLDDFGLAPTIELEPVVAPGEVEKDLTRKAPQGQDPGGFEMVFQSSKPRLPPSWGDLPDRPGIGGAPAPRAPQPAPQEAWPMNASAAAGNSAPQSVSPPAAKGGVSFVPTSPPPQRPAGGAGNMPKAPPPPPARQAAQEPERATEVVPRPPGPPVGNSATPGVSAPRVSAPLSTSPRRRDPGDYTRVVADVRDLGNPPYRAAGAQRPPALCLAPDPPLRSAGWKGKVWVPILILGSLFLTTASLLVYFAFRH